MRARESVLYHKKLLPTSVFILQELTFFYTEVVIGLEKFRWILIENRLALTVGRVGFFLRGRGALDTLIFTFFVQIIVLHNRLIFLFLNDSISTLVCFISVIRVNAKIL